MNARNRREIGVDGSSCSQASTVRRRLGAAARCRVLQVFFLGHSELFPVRSDTPPNFALELARGPFLGTGKVNFMAARRPHLAPSEASSVAAASAPLHGRRG